MHWRHDVELLSLGIRNALADELTELQSCCVSSQPVSHATIVR
jgi:hypothetical protein